MISRYETTRAESLPKALFLGNPGELRTKLVTDRLFPPLWTHVVVVWIPNRLDAAEIVRVILVVVLRLVCMIFALDVSFS